MKSLVTSLTLASLLVGGTAVAGEGSGVVDRLYTQSPSLIYVRMATVSAPAGCSVLSPAEFALDASTTEGKNTYAMLLTAYSLQQNIVVVGKGTCTVKNDREDINYVVLL